MRLLALAIVPLWLIATSASAVDGIDLPGSDYANFPTSSKLACLNACGGDPDCRAWTWVKPGIQGPAGRCWLKHRVPTLVRNTCCSSGPAAYISQREMRAEGRIDRPGSDYRRFDTNSWKTCQTQCGRESPCRAWSYVRAGVQTTSGRCWLKNAVPRPVDNADVVSGVKYRPRSVRLAEPEGRPADD